jgi:hypothetical protein
MIIHRWKNEEELTPLVVLTSHIYNKDFVISTRCVINNTMKRPSLTSCAHILISWSNNYTSAHLLQHGMTGKWGSITYQPCFFFLWDTWLETHTRPHFSCESATDESLSSKPSSRSWYSENAGCDWRTNQQGRVRLHKNNIIVFINQQCSKR